MLPDMMLRWPGYLLQVCVVCMTVAKGTGSVSLENPNGQHLWFLRLSINTAFVGPFAFVENEMVFQNPEARTIEGRFSFSLPTSSAGIAQPSRFAMEINGKLMEGEVVNASKARKIYREILHEARDPALLEQGQGNVFTARVFPIGPNAIVRLILSYALTVPLQSRQRRLVLPLNGLPQIYDFQFASVVRSIQGTTPTANCSLPGVGTVNGNEIDAGGLNFSVQMTGPVVFDSDAVISVFEQASSNNVLSVDGGKLVSLFTFGESENGMEGTSFLPDTWTIYIDTSASTADSAKARAPIIAALLDAMPDVDVEVFAFDIALAELRARAQKDPDLGATVRSGLETRMSMGATDFTALLQHINNRPSGKAKLGIIIITDAIPTASERAAAQLGKLVGSHTDRVIQFGVIGNKFDSAVGSAIAAAGNGRIVRIPFSRENHASIVATAWSEFTRPLGYRATPDVASGWVWPEVAFDLHDGDEVIIFSGGGQGFLMQPPELILGAPPAWGSNVSDVVGTRLKPGTPQAAGASFSSLLSREGTRARLELLESSRQLATTAVDDANLKNQIIQLSEQSRVMCPHTALLVLETEEDYTRFEVSRDNLRPILIVSNDGVRLQGRNDIVLKTLPSPIIITTTQVETTTNSTSTTSSPFDDVVSDCENCDMEEGTSSEGSAGASGGGSMMDEGDVGSCSRVRPPILVFLLVFGMLFECFCNWANLEADSKAIIEEVEHGSEGAKMRKREVAVKYAAALWTSRNTTKLWDFCATWLDWDPTNGLVYEYLGKAASARGDHASSLRAVTSIAEIAPRDSEQLLRGSWVAMNLGTPEAQAWALRFAQRSLEERKDNPNTYRAIGLAAWQKGDFSRAADAYKAGLAMNFHGRYGDVGRVLREEAALFLRSLGDGDRRQLLQSSLNSIDVNEGQDITLLITMSWLTDANDVDLHVIDPNLEECYYSHPTTNAGLQLYSDQTQGLGPEVVALKKHVKGAYKIGVKYFSSGAMGASRGTVVIWRMLNGVPQGNAIIEPFTLPSGYDSVLPVVTVNLE